MFLFSSTDITPEECDLLRMVYGLHPLTTEDLRDADASEKLEYFDSYLFLVQQGFGSSYVVIL